MNFTCTFHHPGSALGAACALLMGAVLGPPALRAAPAGSAAAGDVAASPESAPRPQEPATGPDRAAPADPRDPADPAARPTPVPAGATPPPPAAPARKGANATPAAPPGGKGAAGAASARGSSPERPTRPRGLPQAERPRPSADSERPRPASADDKEPEEKLMRRLQGTAWSLVGVTAVLLTVTGVFALLVEDREDEMERMATFLDPYNGGRPLPYSGVTRRDFERYDKEGKRFEAAAFTFLGLSAAAAVGAATLFIVDHLTKGKERPGRVVRVQPLMSPRGAGLGVGLEF